MGLSRLGPAAECPARVRRIGQAFLDVPDTRHEEPRTVHADSHTVVPALDSDRVADGDHYQGFAVCVTDEDSNEVARVPV
jgi:hypothetical protein